MTEQDVFAKVIEIITPFARDKNALAHASMDTKILVDLKVNSARLVDIVLRMEDSFDLEVEDDEADQVRTLGDAVKMILTKQSQG